MWRTISSIILRNRPVILLIIAAITIFLGFKAKDVKMSYQQSRMLPSTDYASVDYDDFKKMFGEDGNVMVIGVTNPDIFKLDEFNAWFDLGNDIRRINGIEEVASIARAINVIKNDSLHKFEFLPVVSTRPKTQSEVDSLKKTIMGLNFYKGLLYNPKTNAYMMMVTLDRKKLNDKSRVALVHAIKSRIDTYSTSQKHEVHFSGLPYIRTMLTEKIEHELYLFIMLSIVIAAIILFLFFKSLKIVASSLIVVLISIIWVLGLISLFGFKITILTGVIPSLIVIIAIENCIYVLNKYQWEFKLHGNKAKALSRTIERIGFASLMVNTATATGFAAFILIPNQLLREFGIITSICILAEYLLCITLLPTIFSFLKPPQEKHLAHLNSKFFQSIIEKIIYLIEKKRTAIYISAGILVVIGVFGVLMIRTSGKVVDDIRKTDPIYVDLKYFEKNIGGVMPFEISVDTKKKKGVMRLPTIQKIDELQDAIISLDKFSRPLSVAELVKFAKQAYFNGDPDRYSLPNSQEKNFVLSYFPQKAEGKSNVLKSFIDKDQQTTRISFQMADEGTKEINRILKIIRPKVDSIFPAADYTVKLTGNSLINARGTEFLIRNLFESVAIAIVLISLLMALMFSSVRMIMVSMAPNLIPLLITAALMGFSGIPIKPSTIIVFSIALGISVDNAIQYLARYRHELKTTNHNIRLSAINALREAGFSMIYTSIVLVLGFSVFIVSSFGGTQALGLLISTTLFIAMFFNIMVLPSLLLTLDKMVVTTAFEAEPLIEVYGGNDDGSNGDEIPQKE
jgi:uncharacterized protein